MEKLVGAFAHFRSSPRRALAMEIALLSPAFGLVMLGVFQWCGYFWIQHRVQTAANEALAAARTTADPGARIAMARAAAGQILADQVADLNLASSPAGLTLQLAYDASASPIFAAGGFIPLPPPVIVRKAQVR